MKDLVPICIVGFIVYGIYKLFELFVRKSERMALINKLSELKTDEPLKFPDISFGSKSSVFWPLRIALLLIGIGFGLTVAYITRYCIYTSELAMRDFNVYELRELISTIYFACIALFGGIGLLVAFFIERKESKV